MIEKSDTEFYCAMPWHGAFYTNKGMGPCCSWQDLQTTTPIRFLGSDYLKQVKVDMLNGKVPPQCDYCYQQEQNGFYSTRQLYTDHFVSQKWMKPSRSLETRSPEVLEVRFSNLCNMQCRICNADWSHLIGREVQQTNSNILKNFYKVSVQSANEDPLKEMSDESVQQITELAKQAKHVYLTGGEPTIHKQAIRLIDTLVETGHAKTQMLQISTNASAINPNLLEKFKEFRRVILTLSIDATGPVANYQRYGSDWTVIEKNVRSLCDLKNSVDSVDLYISMSVSACSVLDIDTTIKWYLDLWDYCKLGLGISIVHYPFHAIMLRGKARQLAAKKVHQAITLFEEKIKLAPELTEAMSESGNNLEELRKLYRALVEPENNDQKSIERYNTRFYLPMQELDRVRGQSFEQLFGLPLDPPDNYSSKDKHNV
jgi:hypothetical protein